MNANYAPAFRAGPSYFLISDKLSYAQRSDILKIFEHAHPVFCPIPFIKVFQPVAWEFFTIKTEPCLNAVFNLTSETADFFILIVSSTAGAFILFPEIRQADPAVHTAWSDQSGFDHFWVEPKLI